MKITFPFEYITVNIFGKIYRPYATVFVLNKSTGMYVRRTLIVDTGADFTLFPRINARLFGIDIGKETEKSQTFGVGGKETVYLYKGLSIKIGEVKLKIPVGFIDRNDVPALLGRQHFLELFEVLLKDHKTIFGK